MKSSEFNLIPFEACLIDVWNNIVKASKNGNFLHLREYMNYHAHRFEEKSVIVYKNGIPVAVFPCNKIGEEIVSHAGLTYSGLIYGVDLHSVDVLKIFDSLRDYYRYLGCTCLIYKVIPHVFHRYPAEEDLYALFRHDAVLVKRDLSTVIPLPLTIKFSDSRKNTIKKAEKNGLIIVEGGFMPSFHNLLSEVLARRGISPVHSLDELVLLTNRFPRGIRLFGAFRNGNELLAGALIYDFGHVAHTQYLASSEDGKKTGALDLLLSCAVTKYFSHCKNFSFGVSTENNGKFLNDGLVFQKEGFGGRAVVHDVYKLEI